MVKLTRIYTKSGDKGKTSLGDGTRRKKSDLRFNAIGEIDEVNALLGLVILQSDHDIQKLLQYIQNDLFDLGADLCIPNGNALRITKSQVNFLEKCIDRYNKHLSPLNSFVLPGGSNISAWLHLLRTVIRRAERSLFLLNEVEPINPNALCYINRLSDLVFVLSRHCNNKGKDDVLWKPGANR